MATHLAQPILILLRRSPRLITAVWTRYLVLGLAEFDSNPSSKQRHSGIRFQFVRSAASDAQEELAFIHPVKHQPVSQHHRDPHQ
jgi:hypothetical protein